MSIEKYLAGAPESVGVDPRRLAELFERAEREVQQGILPSAQIAVAREGRIAAMQTFGRLPDGRDATDDTLYVIFSCTKALVSATGWLLLEEGKLALEERVADIVPGFGTNGKDRVTVEHLFTHTAGFPHAPLGPPDWADPERRLARYARWRLTFEPGSAYEYHPSSGMWVLGDVISRRAGTDWRELFRRRIALPLGLDDLWVGLPAELNARVADIEFTGKEPTSEQLERLGIPPRPVTEVTEENVMRFNQPEVRAVGVPGGGGITTAASLALFYQALLHDGHALGGPQVWKPETIRAAREIRTGDLVDPVFGKHACRGLGISIAGDGERNFRGFGHTNSPLAFGHNGAGGQIAWADPETGLSLGYCTNGHDRDWVRLARRSVGISSRAALCAAV